MISTLTSLTDISKRNRTDGDNLQQENTVRKSRQRVDLAIAVWEASVRAPFTHNCGRQTYSETGAIEQHVYTICEQAQGAADKAVEELYKHKSQIKSADVSGLQYRLCENLHAKVCNSSRISLNQYTVNDRPGGCARD